MKSRVNSVSVWFTRAMLMYWPLAMSSSSWICSWISEGLGGLSAMPVHNSLRPSVASLLASRAPVRPQRMDPEKTAPFELGSGDDACLLLHGFTGSPWDMRPLGERLSERGYAVRAIRLPGHGSTPLA